MAGVKKILVCVLTVMAVFWYTEADFQSFAAESSVIEKVTVKIDTDFGAPEEIPDPVITADGNGYSLGDVQFKTDYDKWEPGKKVRVDINLFADEGKFFPTSLNRSECKVTGADFVSAKALDDTTLQVKVDYRPVMTLGDTAEAGWSSTSSRKAVWKKVDFAPGYTVTLYGDDKVVKRLNVETSSVDLSSYMTKDDVTYYYEVKAVPLTSDEKKYFKEGNYVTSRDTEVELDTEEKQYVSRYSAGDGGEVKGSNYVYGDGQLARNSWKKLSDKWYYFDQNGNMAKGWIFVNGYWYYMNENGVMQTGWINLGDGWRYLGEDGSLRTGWLNPSPDKWYYLNAYGFMQTQWVMVDGKWYFMEADGSMKTGWLNWNNCWYYLNADGSMAENTIVDGWYIAPGGIATKL